MRLPPGVTLPFPWVRVRAGRAFISGHGPLLGDGSLAGPLGKVGAEVSQEQAYEAARLTALAVLAGLQRELGDLDRVTAWLRVFGMVNAGHRCVGLSLRTAAAVAVARVTQDQVAGGGQGTEQDPWDW